MQRQREHQLPEDKALVIKLNPFGIYTNKDLYCCKKISSLMYVDIEDTSMDDDQPNFFDGGLGGFGNQQNAPMS